MSRRKKAVEAEPLIDLGMDEGLLDEEGHTIAPPDANDIIIEPADRVPEDVVTPPLPAEKILRSRRRIATAPGQEPTLRVLLDPGHGGRDAGAVWQDPKSKKLYMEKDINMNIAQMVYEFLPPEVDVYITRTADEFVSYRNRAITSFEYDLLISIHCNAIDAKRYDPDEVRGTEVLVFNPKDALLRGLAESFAQAAAKALGIGLNEPNYIRSGGNLRVLSLAESVQDRYGRSKSILRLAPFCDDRFPRGEKGKGYPAVLLELGYITNPKDREALFSPARQRDVAAAIAGVIGEIAPSNRGIVKGLI